VAARTAFTSMPFRTMRMPADVLALIPER